MRVATWDRVTAGGDVGAAGAGSIFASNFEGESLGTDTGSNWKETGSGNSTSVNDSGYYFVAPPAGGVPVGIDDSGSGVNSHIHYNGSGASGLSDYSVTGTFCAFRGQWGLTAMSVLWRGSEDEYYRIRAYGGKSTRSE